MLFSPFRYQGGHWLMPTFSANLRSNKITCVKYCRMEFARLNGIRICFVQLLRSKGLRKWGETPWKFSEKRKKFLPQKKYNGMRLLHVEKKYARNFHRFFTEPVRISQQCLNHVVLIIRTAPAPLHIPVCIDLIRKTKKNWRHREDLEVSRIVLISLTPASKTDHIRLIRKL